MLTTTLNRIREYRPCAHGWEKLLRGLGKTGADDEPLPYGTILRISGLDDTLWCCRVEPQYEKEWRLFTVWCARQVEHLLTDPRSIHAVDTAERYALGTATEEELGVASEAVRDVLRDVYRDAVGMAARDAAWAAAQTTVTGAVGRAVGDASWEAVSAAAHAECEGTSRAVAGRAAKAAQRVEFLRIVEGEKPC
jgi:hypothetical protein